MLRAWSVLGILALAAAPGSAAPRRLATGTWGGEHLRLTVDARAGVDLDFDCARGHIDGVPALDDEGSFEVEGRYLQEHGGPVRKDEDTRGRPVRYRGTVSGDTLTLGFTLDETPQGPFTLQHGKPGRVVKCR